MLLASGALISETWDRILAAVLLAAFAVLIVGGAIYVFAAEARNRKIARAKEQALVDDLNAQLEVAKNPQSDVAVLREILARENPRDKYYFARLTVLRALAQNPNLPVELQAAAINRVTQEEAAARIDKALRNLDRYSRGPTGFAGFTMDV